MEITLKVSDEILRLVVPEGKDPARTVLEALALEGYRSEALSEHEVCQMLGLDSRMEVHAFLKRHGVYLNYGAAELDKDMAAATVLASEIRAERSSGKQR